MSPIRAKIGLIWWIFFKIKSEIACRATGGGVQGQNFDFFFFLACNSPNYLVSKMGSFFSQLATVAEIWRDENGYYTRIFGYLYRKILKKWELIFRGNAFPETLDGQILVKMAKYLHPRDI